MPRGRGCGPLELPGRPARNCGWWSGTAIAGSKPPTHRPTKSRRCSTIRRHFAAGGADSSATPTAFDHALRTVAAANADLGVDRACDLFFAAERDYWMSRNRAGRLQRARQDALGLGWGNHDHHTYRSSREHFHRLIALLEALGVACRERFYAGIEAGWGAQVMEQPACQVMVFADVDLSPEEVAGDFAHGPLPPRDHLGTVGLWCALHGEAVLQAGMHHLEAQFDFDGAREQLAREGIKSMDPFTDFPFLRQSFTQGEIWPVEPQRIAAALAAGYITATRPTNSPAAARRLPPGNPRTQRRLQRLQPDRHQPDHPPHRPAGQCMRWQCEPNA